MSIEYGFVLQEDVCDRAAQLPVVQAPAPGLDVGGTLPHLECRVHEDGAAQELRLVTHLRYRVREYNGAEREAHGKRLPVLKGRTILLVHVLERLLVVACRESAVDARRVQGLTAEASIIDDANIEARLAIRATSQMCNYVLNVAYLRGAD